MDQERENPDVNMVGRWYMHKGDRLGKFMRVSLKASWASTQEGQANHAAVTQAEENSNVRNTS